MDLLNKKALSLDTVKRVVLDEADEMLNMGFRKDIEKILSMLPEQILQGHFGKNISWHII